MRPLEAAIVGAILGVMLAAWATVLALLVITS